MNFVTRRHIPRRTFLRGAGTAIALPFLDAMIPAFARAEESKPPLRMVFMYVTNGIMMNDWTPAKEGADYDFTRILKPLEPYRDEMLVISGLSQHAGNAPVAGDHARASVTYLTGVRPKDTTSADVEAGISVDQVAAKAIGDKTRFASLELGCEISRSVGSCDSGYSCAYINSMSWSTPKVPNPPETNPRLLFERIYGSLAADPDPKVRARNEADRKSILDLVTNQSQSLMSQLGSSDQHKVDEYLTSVRDVEQRIQFHSSNADAAPTMAKPVGIPPNFVDHAQLMNDLLLNALRADMTRVATFIYSKESSTRSYPELGFDDPHHPCTHHRNNPDLMERVTKINTHHVTQFAEFVRKAKAIKEGNGTLLDNSMVVYGSSLSDGNNHVHENLPLIMLGKGGGTLKTGRHIVYPDQPMTNLWLALLDRMGVPTDKLGDSTGEATHLSAI
jgi:Protein of unknown function (DUF1552)